MQGGPHPIENGDWLIMRPAQGVGMGALEGQVTLVQTPEEAEGFGHAYQVKRIVREDGRWMLRSDNPAHPSYPAPKGLDPIALLVEVVPPNPLAPKPRSLVADGEVGNAFGLKGEPHPGRAERVEGHLFLMVEEKGRFIKPDRLHWEVPDRRPGETAFVLVRAPANEELGRVPDREAWRYLGVARWVEDEGAWRCPELDFAMWRALGAKESVSRELSERYRDQARELVDRVLKNHGAGAVLEHGSKRFRILGRSARGSLRIDGGPGGFEPRSVSLIDLGWALAARDRARSEGVTLDESLVNEVRYLEDTPEGSTRWIDTEWALAIVGLQ